MKVVAFSSIKGGTGKSSLAILSANYCAAAGARVLVLDLDIQNSASFFYLDDFEVIDQHNIAQALHTGRLQENIVKSNYPGIDLIPSHFSLVNLRAIGERTLKKLLSAKLPYDFVFIDCAPTYDNIVLNGVNAADLIFTPVQFTQFDFKGCVFYRDQLNKETDRISAWRVLFNFYRPPRTDSTESTSAQYEAGFRETFDKAVVPVKIPDAALVRTAIDRRVRVTEAASKARLHDAISSLAEYIGVKGKAEGF